MDLFILFEIIQDYRYYCLFIVEHTYQKQVKDFFLYKHSFLYILILQKNKHLSFLLYESIYHLIKSTYVNTPCQLIKAKISIDKNHFHYR